MVNNHHHSYGESIKKPPRALLLNSIQTTNYALNVRFRSIDPQTHTGKINKLTPFLHKNIIQHYAGLPVFSLFNQHFDRYPVRYEAFQRFGSDIFWKKTKRSSS